jgi:hypothetical protein
VRAVLEERRPRQEPADFRRATIGGCRLADCGERLTGQRCRELPLSTSIPV